MSRPRAAPRRPPPARLYAPPRMQARMPSVSRELLQGDPGDLSWLPPMPTYPERPEPPPELRVFDPHEPLNPPEWRLLFLRAWLRLVIKRVW